MSNVFFSADTHFYHRNIIKYCNRPFASEYEMNDALVERWNSKVGENDIVFHLGDVMLGREDNLKEALNLIYSLNGRIRLVPGNHDKMALRCADIIKQSYQADDEGMNHAKLFVLPELYTYYHQDPSAPKGRRMIVLCHYAMRVWDQSHRGSWNLFGHSHGTLPDLSDSLSMDVGVDTNNFYVYSYQDIETIMGKKNFVPLARDGNKTSYKETKKYYETGGYSNASSILPE